MRKGRRSVRVKGRGNPFSARLEHVRTKVARAKTLQAFLDQLEAIPQADGSRFNISYSAALNYHYDREPPVMYLAHVARVFGVRIEWLANGDGPVTTAESDAPELAAIVMQTESYRAFRDQLGTLVPPAISGVEPIVRRAVLSVVDVMLARGDNYGEDHKARQVEAARTVGRAIASQLEALSLDPSFWPEPVKAQYLIQTIATLLVPLDLEWERAAILQLNDANAALAVEQSKNPPAGPKIPIYFSASARKAIDEANRKATSKQKKGKAHAKKA